MKNNIFNNLIIQIIKRQKNMMMESMKDNLLMVKEKEKELCVL